jgi:23S rRNA pseudoU1915 N3-methylase RlmH
MPSINAQNVAKEVIKRVEKGEKVVLGEIMENCGYAEASQKNPKSVTETDSYKETIEPFLTRLEKHRNRILVALEGKDLPKEKFKDLSDSLSKTTHDIQLLSGGDTERSKVLVLPSEVIEKYGLGTSQSSEGNS